MSKIITVTAQIGKCIYHIEMERKETLAEIISEVASLEADHIKDFALFQDLRLDINNGRTLCKSCNSKKHNKINYIHENPELLENKL